MEQWMKISLLLCIFGFLKEVRPSEPLVYDYLIGPWRNVTDDEVLKQVLPVGTYSNMILLVLVFMITDMCRYKPLIVVLGLSGMAIWAMLIWTTSLFMLQVLEVSLPDLGTIDFQCDLSRCSTGCSARLR
jgi:thiamine transporter 2/3